MKALFFSGGATKFIGLISASARLYERDYRPDLIAGVSSGSITAILTALGMWNTGIDIGTNLTLKTIFSECPVNPKGKITMGAIIKLIRGKNYLGKMDNLESLLRATIPFEMFQDYVMSNKPKVAVIAVNASTRSRKAFFLKELSYDKAIKAIMASSTIPGAGEAVEIDGEYYYDGGLRDHSPGPYMLEKTGIKFSEVISVYSRPEDYVLPVNESWKKNVFSLFTDLVIQTYNIEVSKNDEFVERSVCQYNKIPYTGIFIEPFVDKLFDVDKSKLVDGYHKGVEAVDKYYNV